MSVTKNQHYVSQGILKHFADNNEKTYEIYIGKKIISKKSIASTMAQNYAYEHPQIERNTVEDIFANVEGKIFPILDKMIIDMDQKYHDGETV